LALTARRAARQLLLAEAEAEAEAEAARATQVALARLVVPGEVVV